MPFACSVGENPGVMVLLKVVLHASRPNQPPCCLIVSDAEQTVCAVSVYHLNEAACARFGDKDTIVIMDPLIKEVVLSFEGKVRRCVHSHWHWLCALVLVVVERWLCVCMCGRDSMRTAYVCLTVSCACVCPLRAQDINYRTVQVFQSDKFVVNGRTTASSYKNAGLTISVFDQ